MDEPLSGSWLLKYGERAISQIGATCELTVHSNVTLSGSVSGTMQVRLLQGSKLVTIGKAVGSTVHRIHNTSISFIPASSPPRQGGKEKNIFCTAGPGVGRWPICTFYENLPHAILATWKALQLVLYVYTMSISSLYNPIPCDDVGEPVEICNLANWQLLGHSSCIPRAIKFVYVTL